MYLVHIERDLGVQIDILSLDCFTPSYYLTWALNPEGVWRVLATIDSSGHLSSKKEFNTKLQNTQNKPKKTKLHKSNDSELNPESITNWEK